MSISTLVHSDYVWNRMNVPPGITVFRTRGPNPLVERYGTWWASKAPNSCDPIQNDDTRPQVQTSESTPSVAAPVTPIQSIVSPSQPTPPSNVTLGTPQTIQTPIGQPQGLGLSLQTQNVVPANIQSQGTTPAAQPTSQLSTVQPAQPPVLQPASIPSPAPVTDVGKTESTNVPVSQPAPQPQPAPQSQPAPLASDSTRTALSQSVPQPTSIPAPIVSDSTAASGQQTVSQLVIPQPAPTPLATVVEQSQSALPLAQPTVSQPVPSTSPAAVTPAPVTATVSQPTPQGAPQPAPQPPVMVQTTILPAQPAVSQPNIPAPQPPTPITIPPAQPTVPESSSVMAQLPVPPVIPAPGQSTIPPPTVSVQQPRDPGQSSSIIPPAQPTVSQPVSLTPTQTSIAQSPAPPPGNVESSSGTAQPNTVVSQPPIVSPESSVPRLGAVGGQTSTQPGEVTVVPTPSPAVIPSQLPTVPAQAPASEIALSDILKSVQSLPFFKPQSDNTPTTRTSLPRTGPYVLLLDQPVCPDYHNTFEEIGPLSTSVGTSFHILNSKPLERTDPNDSLAAKSHMALGNHPSEVLRGNQRILLLDQPVVQGDQ